MSSNLKVAEFPEVLFNFTTAVQISFCLNDPNVIDTLSEKM